MKNNSTKNVAAGIVALCGIISGLIALFATDFTYGFDYGYYIYLVIDILYIVACILIGIAFLAGNDVLLAVGSLVGAVTEILVVVKSGTWISNGLRDAYYYGYTTVIWNAVLLLSAIICIAAFVMLALVAFKKAPVPNGTATTLIILFAACLVMQTVYPFRYLSSYSGNFGDFMGAWFKNELSVINPFLLLIGLIIFLAAALGNKAVQSPAYGIPTAQGGYQAARPVAQPVQPVQPVAQPVQPVAQPVQPVAQPVQPVAQPVQPVAQPVQATVQPVQPAAEPAAEAASASADYQAKLELLHKFKDLLDAGVITQEEFDAKKDSLLK